MANVFKKLVKKIGSTRNGGRLKKQFFVAPLVILLLFLDVKPAHAEPLSYVAGLVGDILFTVVGKAVFFVSYIISFIAGIFIAIEAWLIGAILNINSNIVNSAPVKFGFPVSLSIVNLGFVLGVIVIAVATILRYEQYGMKKILLKLVVAAVLVNFSLVIAGVILNFADNLTGYFLQSVPRGGTTNGIISDNNFASAIAGAFNPQRSFITDLNTLNATTSAGINTGNAGVLQGIDSSFGGDISKILTPITSLAFVVFSLVLIMITLFALIIMLVIRYVYLGILLVIMPFAWLLWVFPNFQSQWNKWWHNFLRWTFFSPIVVFFLWLGIQTSAEISKGANGTYSFAQYTSTSNNPAWAMISGFFTNLFSPIVENFLQMTVVLGLMLGGLFAANSFGITFANTAMGSVKAVGKGVGGWAGRRGKQLGGAALDRTRMRRVAERLQQVGAKSNAATRLVTLPVRYAGRGIENVSVATRETLVKDAKKRLAPLTDDQLGHNMTTFTAPERMAALEILREHGSLIDKIQTKNIPRYADEDLYKRYKQQDLYSNLTKGKGVIANSEAIQAAIDGDITKLDETLKKIIPSINKSQIGDNKNLNDLFGGKTAEEKTLNKYQIRNLLTQNFSLISSIIPKLNSVSRNNFEKLSAEGLGELKSEGRITQAKHDELETLLKNIILNNTKGLIIETGPAQAPAPAPPATGT